MRASEIIWLNNIVWSKPSGRSIAIYTMRALPVSCINNPNVDIAIFNDIRRVIYKTNSTTVINHIRADMAYSLPLLRHTIPMMCIGTPATITVKQSVKNMIRHRRCCQLLLRWSRNLVSRCIFFDFILF